MYTYFLPIFNIANCLNLCEVPFSITPLANGWQLLFPWTKGDVACHSGTFGSSVGKVESYNFPWDCGDVTSLTPEDAAMKIIEYYFKLKEKRS